jgi:putative transposase
VRSYLHYDTDESPTIGVREPSPDLTDVSAASWAEAVRRLQIIRSLAEKEGRTRDDARAAAALLGCRVAQVYSLLRRYMGAPSASSLLPRRPGPCTGLSRLSPEIDAVIDLAIATMYLSKQRPRLADLADEVRRRCRALNLPAPGRKAITTRVRQKPRATVVARRDGRRAARDRLSPVLGSLESPGPLGIVQIDHTLVDVIVVDSVSRAPIQRPWLTLAIDVYSRCVAGFHLSLEPPSATSVALCVTHAVLPKDSWLAQRGIEARWPVSGLMTGLHLDNAKEFHSEALRRGCEQYGIAIDYRPVRTPHYGGHIERLIGTLMGKVHLLPGTTFSDIASKGDSNPEKSAAMTLNEVEHWLGHAIAGVYHNQLHRALASAPLAAWQAGIEATSGPAGFRRRGAVADADRFFLDFLPIERRMIRRDGVRLNSICYWSDVLRTLIGNPDRMIVRYDPRDLSRVYLLAPDGNYYNLSYADLRRPPISLWEHRLALTKLRELGRSAIDEDTIFGAVDAMHRIANSAVSETKAVRRMRERRRRSRPADAVASDSVETRMTPPETLTAEMPLMDVEEWS